MIEGLQVFEACGDGSVESIPAHVKKPKLGQRADFERQNPRELVGVEVEVEQTAQLPYEGRNHARELVGV